MKRFLWVTPMLFVLMLGSAFADSTIFFIPNDGSGDNFGFLQRGGGVIIGIHGGTAVDFFNVFGYAPGSTLGGFSTEVFNSGSFAQFGGNSYELGFSGPATLFMSSFTLPTNGKDFTAQVELDFSASVFILLDTGPGQPFGVGGGAVGKIPFHFLDGFYYPDSFTTAPEPGTLGLMGMGLMSILALARKRLSI